MWRREPDQEELLCSGGTSREPGKRRNCGSRRTHIHQNSRHTHTHTEAHTHTELCVCCRSLIITLQPFFRRGWNNNWSDSRRSALCINVLSLQKTVCCGCRNVTRSKDLEGNFKATNAAKRRNDMFVFHEEVMWLFSDSCDCFEEAFHHLCVCQHTLMSVFITLMCVSTLINVCVARLSTQFQPLLLWGRCCLKAL